MLLNVILPCAGEGTRLGLPYPKEIHQVDHNLSLIDLSLRLCLPYREKISRMTVVLTGNKPEVVRYLSRWRQHFPLCFCYFNDRYSEWAGSIRSAQPLYLEKNIVLLPDSFLLEAPEFPLIPTYDQLLEEFPVVFACQFEQSDRLSSLGALRVDLEGYRVSQFCDKPERELDRYNAFWASFGFTRCAAQPLLELMAASIARYPVDIQALGVPVRAFPVAGYEDLGTWPNLSRNSLRRDLRARNEELQTRNCEPGHGTKMTSQKAHANFLRAIFAPSRLCGDKIQDAARRMPLPADRPPE